MGYAPPEQYGRAQTTERSDIYSLGATLYECLSGYDPSQSPFRFPPLQTLVPTLPEWLVTLITQMLEMDEGKRPASITVVERELQQVSAPSASKSAPKRRVLKPATPKQPAPTPPVASIPYTPPPASSAPTQYAQPPVSMQHAPTQVASPVATPIPYAPSATQGGQISIQPAPVTNFAPIPAQPSLIKKTLDVIRRIPTSVQQSLIRKTLAVIGKALSIIGMIVGGLFALFGILGLFVPGEGFIVNLWSFGLFFFLGLGIFFIARIEKSSFSASKAKRIEAIAGKIAGVVAIIFGIILIILGPIIYNLAEAKSGTILAGVFIIIEGVIIWWVTRIRIKTTP